MKYLIKAKLKQSKRTELMNDIDNGVLGDGSVAFGEYEKNMRQARLLDDGTVCWVQICFCSTPLNEETPYWEKYFEIISVENAHDPKHCHDSNGDIVRGCFDCFCTQKLEDEMRSWGTPFIVDS